MSEQDFWRIFGWVVIGVCCGTIGYVIGVWRMTRKVDALMNDLKLEMQAYLAALLSEEE